MATFVCGDIHGQYAALERLLARLPFDAERDHLWLVGDLVNRGPNSLQVLRWAQRTSERMGERMVVVLGNHDVRLLALARGLGSPKQDLEEIFRAPDRAELLEWLGQRPLFHRRGDDVLVHAGLLPDWTLAEAENRAREAEAALHDGNELLAEWHAHRKKRDVPCERPLRTLEVLTSIRTCTRDGHSCDWSGPPDGAPWGCRPWFRWPHRHNVSPPLESPQGDNAGARIFFGHWAALGVHTEGDVRCLDGGAAWGGHVTVRRLEDEELFQETVG